MSPSPKSPCTARTRRSGPTIFLLSVLTILVLAAVFAGCGGGQEKDVVLAKVGNSEVTASYYEDRLKTMKKGELPRAANGARLDMSLTEGKEKFLETLINKEVMVQTAESLGMQNDPAVVKAREAMLAYEADLIMWRRVIKKPSEFISHEELDAFYAKMGLMRPCLFLITNFLDDAEAAREMALGGADWEDVVMKYHDGSESPTGVNELTVPFGRYAVEFENGVFNTEIGSVTPPITTVYGYWVLKVLGEKQGKRPPLEEAKAQILDVTMNRKKAHLREEFKKNVEEKFELTIHEDALWKCYLALPEGETLFREGTQEPRTQEELSPLNIATEDMDMVFYSYLGSEKQLKEFTLLDYKIHFDKMSVFQRPKDTEMLGGLRAKVRGEIGKILLRYEAMDLGFYEDPEVLATVNLRIEEMVVNKLYTELITIDERVTPEQMDAFWAEHSQEYVEKRNRAGLLVICSNADQAAEARAKAAEGMDWNDILVSYGTDEENKFKSGVLDKVFEKRGDPVATALFSVEPGELSQPFALDDGRYGVVLVESETPEWFKELTDVSQDVGQRMLRIRKEEVFQAKMEEWKENIPVTIYEENLAGLASWEELTTVEVPENLVPRN